VKKARKKKRRSLARKRKVSDEELSAFVESRRYDFWLAHGCNYLWSDYSEGLWTQLFDLYEEAARPYQVATVLKTVQHLPEKTPVDLRRKRALVRWCRQTLADLYRVELRYGEFRGPHQGELWQFFERFRQGAELAALVP
jgi:hypothetical protein